MPQYLIRRTFIIAQVCLVIGVFGCGAEEGPPLSKATATVKYKETPVAGAGVTFIYEDGQMAAGITDDTGKVNLTTGGREGAPPGKAKVTVTKMSGPEAAAVEAPASSDTPDDIMNRYKNAMVDSSTKVEPKNELPEKYATEKGTPLVAEVSTTATNDFLFELKD